MVNVAEMVAGSAPRSLVAPGGTAKAAIVVVISVHSGAVPKWQLQEQRIVHKSLSKTACGSGAYIFGATK